MSAPQRLVTFALVLALAFGAGWGIGRGVDSSREPSTPTVVVGDDAVQGSATTAASDHAEHDGGGS
jgi:hypothetical protein